MGKEFFVSLLIFCAVLSLGIAVASSEHSDKWHFSNKLVWQKKLNNLKTLYYVELEKGFHFYFIFWLTK